MANSFQRASFNRKLIYSGLIVVLFLVTLAVRGIELSSQKAASWTVRGQAENIDPNKLPLGSRGQLSGHAIRLVLTGSQGLVTCALWLAAFEYQKNQEWNKLEVMVDSVTKLQPNFITPWLFQSWNLTYNVSVELIRLSDMYFYISRGISLLAEGESINPNSPDLRYWLAFYYQNKFTVSDKVNTLRCLYQLSCMPPEQRDYQDYLTEGKDGKDVNLTAFLAFCQKHPQLVRRLRDSTVALSEPRDVVLFLKENQKVPTRYKDKQGTLEEPLKQFPVLPPQFLNDANEELTPKNPISDREADALMAARAWFHYSTDNTVPPPDKHPIGMVTEKMRANYRIPKSPMLVIFLQATARAQTYTAERLQKEGWFDSDPWKVDEYRQLERWFPTEVAIEPSMTSQEAFEKAYREWSSNGELYGMYFDKTALANLYQKALPFAQRRGMSPDMSTVNIVLTAEEDSDPQLKESFQAWNDLSFYKLNSQVTNFKNFLFSTEAEMDKETIEARKLFFKAEQYRKFARNYQAIDYYAQGFAAMKKVLIKKPRFHRGEDEMSTEGDKIQEDLYELQLKYLKLLVETSSIKRREAVLELHDLMSDATTLVSGVPLRGLMNLSFLDKAKLVPLSDRIEALGQLGPMDENDPTGKPWISQQIKDRVIQRLASNKPAGGQGQQQQSNAP